MEAIEKAVEIVGGQTNLANAIGVSPSFVNQWLSGQRPVPATRCRGIELATGGRVTCANLRPDVFGESSAAA